MPCADFPVRSAGLAEPDTAALLRGDGKRCGANRTLLAGAKFKGRESPVMDAVHIIAEIQTVHDGRGSFVRLLADGHTLQEWGPFDRDYAKLYAEHCASLVRDLQNKG